MSNYLLQSACEPSATAMDRCQHLPTGKTVGNILQVDRHRPVKITRQAQMHTLVNTPPQQTD